jgi:hypothetical protein
MLDDKDLNFIQKLDSLKFKEDCFSEEVILYSEALKIVQELQLKLASSILEEVSKAMNMYGQGLNELQEILKETKE